MSRMDKAFIEARENGTIRHKRFEEKDFYPIIDVARFYMPDAESSLVQTVFENLRKELGQAGRAPTMEFKTADGSGALFLTVVQGAVVGQFRDLLLSSYDEVRRKRDERAAKRQAFRESVLAAPGPDEAAPTSKVVQEGFPVKIKFLTIEREVYSQVELDNFLRLVGSAWNSKTEEIRKRDVEISQLKLMIQLLNDKLTKASEMRFGDLLDLSIEEAMAQNPTAEPLQIAHMTEAKETA